MPRRLLRRAAVLGATAYAASKHGQAKGAAATQQQGVAPPPPYAAPAQPPPPAPSTGDTYTELMKLKELLDAGILTKAEFDTQKQKILST